MSENGRKAARRAALSAWGPVALYAAAISALSHQSTLRIPDASPDWLGHLVEFAGLGWLVARGVVKSGGRLTAPATTGAALACLAFGALDETHQSFVPGRFASLADVIADGTGATLALAAFHGTRRVAKRTGRGRSGENEPGAGPELVLLGRPGCHLCDEAESTIRAVLSFRGGTLTKIDIDTDETLRRAHAQEIPVVLIDGKKRFKGRVDPERLHRLLGAWTPPQEGRGK